MSDGKKFLKVNAGLSPEERLAVVEQNYAVILERIQAYDQVLAEFANISSDLNLHGQRLFKLEEKLNALDISLKANATQIATLSSNVQKAHDVLYGSLRKQGEAHNELAKWSEENLGRLYRDSELHKVQLHNEDVERSKMRGFVLDVDKGLCDVKEALLEAQRKIATMTNEAALFKKASKDSHDALRAHVTELLSSFKEMPEFNEWATKIYIKVCNEINDRQKQFYQELDRRSQQLKEQLASDPYTADSVKKILKDDIDALSLDGKNAYIKASNAAQQIQLLEKKVENINLILKKYELNK